MSALLRLGDRGHARSVARPAVVAGASGGLALAAQFVPSALILGQWLPAGIDPGGVPGVGRWRGPRTRRAEVAITFDDGPMEGSTQTGLDVLAAFDVPATFFLLGSNVANSPGLVKDILGAGHEVAVHGEQHSAHFRRSPRWIHQDLRSAVERLRETGAEPRWFRPPYGYVSGGSVLAARRLGLQLVLWSAWGREWADGDVSSITERLGRRVQAGAVVLLHDSDTQAPAGSAARARAVLPRLAEMCHERGLRPVTLSELMRP